jgi:hypothetical protein
MYAQDDRMHLPHALAPRRLAVGALVTLALLSAACSSDSVSRINAPPALAPPALSLSRSSDGGSSGGSSGGSPGAAAGFAVLAGTEVDCTRSTVIGEVGIYPGSVFTPVTPCITGAVHAGDAAAQAAMQAFFTAYDNVAGVSCTGQLLDAYTNMTLTLTPGVYCNPRAAGVTFTDDTLKLNAQGNANAVWIFKIGTPGTAGALGTGALTGTDLSVVMSGGATTCNVTWWVAAGATLTADDAGIPHTFVGTILAGAAITTTGTTATPTDRLSFTGKAFAKAGVTLTDTNLTGCVASTDNGKGHDKGDKHKGKHRDNDKDKHKDKDHGDSNHHDDGGNHGDSGHGDSGHDGGH